MKYLFIDPTDSTVEYETTQSDQANDYVLMTLFFTKPLIMKVIKDDLLVSEHHFHIQPNQ